MNNVHKPLAKGGAAPLRVGGGGPHGAEGVARWRQGGTGAVTGRSAAAHRGSRAAAPGRAVLRGQAGTLLVQALLRGRGAHGAVGVGREYLQLRGPEVGAVARAAHDHDLVGRDGGVVDRRRRTSSTMTTSPLLKVTSSSWASNFCRPSPSAALQVAPGQRRSRPPFDAHHQRLEQHARRPGCPYGRCSEPFCSRCSVAVLRAVVVRGAAVVGGAPVQKRRHRQHAGQNHAHHSHLPLVHNRVPSTQVSARRGARGIGFRL